MPKEAEPPIQHTPEPPQQADVTSPTERHLPPKLELKKFHTDHPQTVLSSPSALPIPQQAVTAMHVEQAHPDMVHVKEKTPGQIDHVDKVIEEVAKGNFNREDDYDFYDRQKPLGKPRPLGGEQLSPRARALLGLTDPSLPPTTQHATHAGLPGVPPLVHGVPKVAQPTQAQQVPTSQQQLPASGAARPSQPPANAPGQPPHVPGAQAHQQLQGPPRTLPSGAHPPAAAPVQPGKPMPHQPPHVSQPSVIQQTPHLQGKYSLINCIFKSVRCNTTIQQFWPHLSPMCGQILSAL